MRFGMNRNWGLHCTSLPSYSRHHRKAVGMYEDDDMADYPYGICPAQVNGVLPDGTPFYYRSRHGQWAIHLGQPGWHPNVIEWPGVWGEHIFAIGHVDIVKGDEVNELLNATFPEWRVSTPKELEVIRECECGKTYNANTRSECRECSIRRLQGWA